MGALEGKTAFITGSSRGIGKATAQRFAAEGANVVLSASRMGEHGSLPGTLESAVQEIKDSGGNAAAVVCDLLDSDARATLIEQASEPFGPIDILVNNAAAGVMKLPSQITSAERNMMFDLNVNVPVELTQQAAPAMKEKGQGWVLNISSRTAELIELPYPDMPIAAWVVGAYGASKAALNRYSEILAHELVEHGIYVNAMSPSYICLTNVGPEVEAIAKRRPDMIEPIEMMAEAALTLCSGTHVAQFCYSRDIVFTTGNKVMSLDGKTLLGDARMPGTS
ncbi:MAG: SDR family NAD(P)-dependent oxidoreductase [Pseudomonadales bacterium]